MLAAGPAAGPTHAFLELLLRTPDAALSGLLLFRVFDPTDELVAGERRDVVPRSERNGVSAKRLLKVDRERVNDTAGYGLALLHRERSSFDSTGRSTLECE